jgi:hypothetical protein
MLCVALRCKSASKVKGTKTDDPREMAVHPTLARILAEWKLSGFEQLTGRQPRPDDPIVPSRRGAYRSVNASLCRFHEDLDLIGLRAGASMMPGARSSRSRARMARWPTAALRDPRPRRRDHGHEYTTLPWPALCDEVSKAKISLREGKLIEMPMPLAIGGASGLAASFAAGVEPVAMIDQKWRSGRDLNLFEMLREPRSRCSLARISTGSPPSMFRSWGLDDHAAGCIMSPPRRGSVRVRGADGYGDFVHPTGTSEREPGEEGGLVMGRFDDRADLFRHRTEAGSGRDHEQVNASEWLRTLEVRLAGTAIARGSVREQQVRMPHSLVPSAAYDVRSPSSALAMPRDISGATLDRDQGHGPTGAHGRWRH